MQRAYADSKTHSNALVMHWSEHTSAEEVLSATKYQLKTSVCTSHMLVSCVDRPDGISNPKLI